LVEDFKKFRLELNNKMKEIQEKNKGNNDIKKVLDI